VYTFGLQPLLAQDASSSGGPSSSGSNKQQPVGWELNLYMELCEEVGFQGLGLNTCLLVSAR
jgi:hypothetical protein